ncbi:hypothetical protein NGB58_25745 [Escherichia coli]|nr:hypothetical protein [Escherichia coli]
MKYTDMKQEVAKCKQILAVMGTLASLLSYTPASNAGAWYGSGAGEWSVTVERASKLSIEVDYTGKTMTPAVRDNYYLGGFYIKNNNAASIPPGGYAAISLDGAWKGRNATITSDDKKGKMTIKGVAGESWKNMAMSEGGWFRYDNEIKPGEKSSLFELRVSGDQTLVPGKYTVKARSQYYSE